MNTGNPTVDNLLHNKIALGGVTLLYGILGWATSGFLSWLLSLALLFVAVVIATNLLLRVNLHWKEVALYGLGGLVIGTLPFFLFSPFVAIFFLIGKAFGLVLFTAISYFISKGRSSSSYR